MRGPSLPFKILAVHLAFVVAAGVVAAWLVRGQFEKYNRRWEANVATIPAEKLLMGFGVEASRALLLRELEKFPEVAERDQPRISFGLRALLQELPSVKYLAIVDREARIRFASDPTQVDLAYIRDEWRALFASDRSVRRVLSTGPSGALTELMIPIFDEAPGVAERRRLGSVYVRFEPDPAILARFPELQPPSIPFEAYLWPLLVFVVAVAAGAIAVNAITILPVRRLERVLGEFRERGFRGPIDVEHLGLGSEFASTVRTINEMGGRLEALDGAGREREALLATLSQSLEDGMVAIDAGGRPVAWNEAAVRLLAPETGAAGVEARIRQAIVAIPGLLGPGGTPSSREIEIAGSNGERTPVRVTEVPFEARPGESGALLLLRDVAMIRKIETHLLEAGRFAVLAHLAGSLAHEIRNPLHSIGLNASVVEQYVGAPSTAASEQAVRDSLRTIQEETRRLTDLLNNYLGLLKSSPEPAPVDLRDLCRRVLRLLAYAALKARVELRLEGEEDLPPVVGVPDRLQQAVLNLALNAIQAMPQGGVVALRTHYAGGVVRLSVADTGPGLPPGLEEALFDTRVTTKPGGSGLGLPLVRLIAEAHGGSVWYRSEPGRGATFTLVLPAESQQAA
ncbi:MAG TPA: ATP-binding protein [Candidatus Polarisedimenticolaceae bacterium]